MPVAGWPAAPGRTDARIGPRFVAALVVSALVHAAFLGSASQSGTRVALSDAPPERSALAARLISVEPRFLPETLPETPIEPPPRPLAGAAKRKPSAQPSTSRARAGERKNENHSSEAPDTTYYAARQLDSYPGLVTALDLRFPADIDPEVSAGHVLLLVLIDAQGRVNDVSVVEAAPPGVFDEEATRALLSARFKPAVKDGRAVRSRLVVHVTYGKPE